ncbi:S41 family peptidase [Lacinutrix sp. 5H-3-7-4]|uniref:S41 family peptidase n=1 Tax=Lacinutrix sp. (strain 5H-3-7-4) TaxID=983544 RepID=UPI00020A3E59|nr:S41 family peptidase [Lacinutrix sp. 5H-3-7-4]AEH01862.1 peptidase S41 [Lacinutrix sp. 5H-3-7-4]
MKKIARLLFLAFITINITSCFNDDFDDNDVSTSSINDFVYRAMDIFYLYRDEVPALVEDKRNSANYTEYLNSFSTPETLFESLIFDRQNVDRFSFILSDYIAFEQQQQGVSVANGMEYGLLRYTEGSDDVFGYVRYVLPNTSAEDAGVQRGDLFYGIDGTPLTVNNFRSLLSQDNYTINLANYNDNGTPETDDDTIEQTTESIALSKAPYTENPVFKTEILQVEGENVGYLMYNGFTGSFDQALNNAFATFQANAIQHLVIDLRYNPGGSVNTATLMGSMVTGQFNGQTFTKLIYNDQLQANNTDFNFTNSFDGGTINNLNLDKVYVLATSASASASELVINSLSSYIDVVHVGTETVGKSQASITLYDSEDYTRNGVNPIHTYALQPLVAISVNVNEDVVPANGLTPDITISEEINNLGILGDENEPLLAEALANIAATNRPANTTPGKIIKPIFDSNDLKPHAKDMYIER